MKVGLKEISEYIDGVLPKSSMEAVKQAIKEDDAIAILYEKQLQIHDAVADLTIQSPSVGFADSVLANIKAAVERNTDFSGIKWIMMVAAFISFVITIYVRFGGNQPVPSNSVISTYLPSEKIGEALTGVFDKVDLTIIPIYALIPFVVLVLFWGDYLMSERLSIKRIKS